ncbi:MAG: hypothetical protein H6Q61_691 [Firmicutes bacterium]|nr:hypothetical protein [Bacillota bacterium]
MHDTHLIEKIYQSIADHCRQSGVVKVNELDIAVDEGSHLDGPHLLSHLMDRNGVLFGPWTTIRLEQNPFEKLTAEIRRIDGESRE